MEMKMLGLGRRKERKKSDVVRKKRGSVARGYAREDKGAFEE